MALPRKRQFGTYIQQSADTPTLWFVGGFQVGGTLEDAVKVARDHFESWIERVLILEAPKGACRVVDVYEEP
jgi:hypothetical protein